MQKFVTTRLSLLLRIRDHRDAQSWSDFMQIYAPLVFRYARRMGLQEADAADVTQDVLRVVSESIDKFDYDRSVGRFRGWLKKVAFYTASQLKRRQQRQAAGHDSAVMDLAAADPGQADARFWDEAYTQRLFELACERVRPKVQSNTWDAFWATAVDSKDPRDVAEELKMNVGSVYVARNRVFARIKEALQELDDR